MEFSFDLTQLCINNPFGSCWMVDVLTYRNLAEIDIARKLSAVTHCKLFSPLFFFFFFSVFFTFSSALPYFLSQISPIIVDPRQRSTRSSLDLSKHNFEFWPEKVLNVVLKPSKSAYKHKISSNLLPFHQFLAHSSTYRTQFSNV